MSDALLTVYEAFVLAIPALFILIGVGSFFYAIRLWRIKKRNLATFFQQVVTL